MAVDTLHQNVGQVKNDQDSVWQSAKPQQAESLNCEKGCTSTVLHQA